MSDLPYERIVPLHADSRLLFVCDHASNALPANHGRLGLPPDEQEGLLEAARFMDSNECNTVIAAARDAAGKPYDQVLKEMDAAGAAFRDAAKKKFNSGGEW